MVFYFQIVEWLNEASMSNNEQTKVQNLCKAQEILLNKDPDLLHMYLDDVLQFALDKNADVRKAIAGFIEDAG